MVRYKGQATAKQTERHNPHWVDIPIPEGGLRRRLDDMHDWHAARGIQPRRGRAGLWTARFCFANIDTAEEFALAFKSSG